MIIDQLVGFLVIEPVHPGLSHQLGTGCTYFFGFIPEFKGAILSVVDDVSVDKVLIGVEFAKMV